MIREIPRTRPTLAMLEPMRLPKDSSLFFCEIEEIVTASSGRDVPRAMRVAPMTNGESRKDLLIRTENLTSRSAENTSRDKLAINSMSWRERSITLDNFKATPSSQALQKGDLENDNQEIENQKKTPLNLGNQPARDHKKEKEEAHQNHDGDVE